eukprot:COSAG01_NODE_21709_length_889_cov_0.601266_1_plen_216_part_10
MQEAAEIDIDMHVCKPAACCMLAYAKPPRAAASIRERASRSAESDPSLPQAKPQRPYILMEPQPETATVLVCGTAFPVTAGELELAGLQVKGPEAFSALSRLVNLRTITLSKMTFSDAGWESLVAGIKGSPHLTHLNLTACGLGPKHAADLADVFSSSGCNITTLCLAKNGLTGATFYSSGNIRAGVDSNLDGIITLLTALKKSQVICIDFSGCGL